MSKFTPLTPERRQTLELAEQRIKEVKDSLHQVIRNIVTVGLLSRPFNDYCTRIDIRDEGEKDDGGRFKLYIQSYNPSRYYAEEEIEAATFLTGYLLAATPGAHLPKRDERFFDMQGQFPRATTLVFPTLEGLSKAIKKFNEQNLEQGTKREL